MQFECSNVYLRQGLSEPLLSTRARPLPRSLEKPPRPGASHLSILEDRHTTHEDMQHAGRIVMRIGVGSLVLDRTEVEDHHISNRAFSEQSTLALTHPHRPSGVAHRAQMWEGDEGMSIWAEGSGRVAEGVRTDWRRAAQSSKSAGSDGSNIN